MKIELIALKPHDRDLTELIRIHREPDIAAYISVSANYFEYVTHTDGVVYYKIVADGEVRGGIHCEFKDETIFLSVCVESGFHRRGIAEKALKLFFAMSAGDAKTVEVSIDKNNVPSIRLFQKLGFIQIGNDEELITYRLPLL